MNIIRQTLRFTVALTLSAFVPLTGSCYGTATAKTIDNMAEKKVTVTDFTEIRLIGSYKIIYTQGKYSQLTIKGPLKAIENASVETKKGILTISTKTIAGVRVINNSKQDELVTVYVTSPKLEKATLIGSGDFISNKAIKADKLQITLHGSGDMKFNDVTCNSINTSLNGSGDISFKKLHVGTTASIALNGSGDLSIDRLTTVNANASLNGSGDFAIANLECNSTNLNVNGSGDMKVAAVTANTANTSVHGSGNLSVNLLECGSLFSAITGTGDIVLSGKTNTYRKSTNQLGNIRDNRLNYNTLVSSQTTKSSRSTSSPSSPGKIEARP